MERAFFVILALGLNAVAMGPWATRPMAPLLHYPALLLRGVERKLNRPQRTLKVRRQRGLLLLTAVLMTGLSIGLAIKRTRWPWLDIAVLAVLLPVRPAWDRANGMGKSLQAGDVASTRLMLQGTVWRHYALLDDHALARAAIEMLAVGFSEKILAPVFWYLLLGMPGFLLAKSLYLLNETLCQPLNTGNGFSRPVSWLHGFSSFVPSRLSALIWLMAMPFLPAASSFATIEQVIGSILSLAAPEQVSVMAAACVLGLSLGGPTSVYTESQWVGSGSAKAAAVDVRRAVYMVVLLQVVLVLLLALLAR